MLLCTLKALLLACFCLSLAACKPPPSAHKLAVESGRKTVPWITEFESVYPDSINYITHFNIKGGIRSWNTEAFLFDRYTVKMEIPDVKFDASDRHVISWGDPTFILMETTKVDLEAGNTETGQFLIFGTDKWKRLVAAKGDLTVLGVKVDMHSPVPHFDTVKNRNRE